MKNLCYFLLAFSMACASTGKTTKTEDGKTENGKKAIPVEEEGCFSSEEVFVAVEYMPEFPGGDLARMKFLQENIIYPKSARRKGIQGTVFATFVIERDGSITDVRVLRGIGGGCDEEVVRVIQNMPKWKPGIHKGKPVRVQFNMPVRFTLSSGRN